MKIAKMFFFYFFFKESGVGRKLCFRHLRWHALRHVTTLRPVRPARPMRHVTALCGCAASVSTGATGVTGATGATCDCGVRPVMHAKVFATCARVGRMGALGAPAAPVAAGEVFEHTRPEKAWHNYFANLSRLARHVTARESPWYCRAASVSTGATDATSDCVVWLSRQVRPARHVTAGCAW